MSYNIHHGLFTVETGIKLTDDAILPVLQIVYENKGVEYVPPSVLTWAGYPHVGIPDLSHSQRVVLAVHLGISESDGHWVLVTYENKAVTVYDSLNSSVICPQLRQVIDRVFGFADTVQIVPVVTTQRNSVDCGVLVVAFATEFAFGRDPATARFEYDALRPHLAFMLRSKRFVAFPKLVSIGIASERQRVIVPAKKSP